MTLENLKEKDKALYYTLHSIAYNTLDINWIEDKNCIIYKRETYKIESRLSPKILPILVDFISKKLDTQKSGDYWFTGLEDETFKFMAYSDMFTKFIEYNILKIKYEMRHPEKEFNTRFFEKFTREYWARKEADNKAYPKAIQIDKIKKNEDLKKALEEIYQIYKNAFI